MNTTLRDAGPGAGRGPWERLALAAAVLLRGRDERGNSSRGFPHLLLARRGPAGSFIWRPAALSSPAEVRPGPLRPPPPGPAFGRRCRGQMAAGPACPGGDAGH